MAGGGEALGSGGGFSQRGKSKRKKKKRLGFRLDMTPLVDITFLLLTFFMFTTTMLKPQTMEMRMPPEIGDVEVPKSQLLSLLIRGDGKVFYISGLDPTDEPRPIAVNKIRDLAITENLRTQNKNKLITVLKVAEDAKYDKVVNVLDELNIAETKITDAISKDIDPKTGAAYKRERKFALAKLTKDDLKKVEGL